MQLNTVCTYVPWMLHQRAGIYTHKSSPLVFDWIEEFLTENDDSAGHPPSFTGDLDLPAFLKEAQAQQLMGEAITFTTAFHQLQYKICQF